MTTIILFFLGFIFLIKGADWLVSGASSLAFRFGVSALVVGLTIVAFGTSAPELIVSLLATMNGSTDLAIANVTGSNIANILLILGISAFIYPLTVQKSTVWKEIPFALLSMIVLLFIANDQIIDGASASMISHIDGLILLSFFAIFLYYIFGTAFQDAKTNEKVIDPDFKAWRVTLQIVAGIGGLVVGGKWIVDGAVFFASSFGVSESLIGLTIVAIGTSLPELATSAVAAYKKNVDIAVGNIIGSNIFNVFWILGMSAAFTPLPFNPNANIDLLVATGATILLFFALFVGQKHTIKKWQGVAFVLLYVVYLGYLVIRG
jgi:cation:H+ antiporter